MYSQDSISRHRRGRAEPTPEVISGLACLICGADFRRAPEVEARVVSHHGDGQLLACHGTCARLACGSATGLDETPLPLAERVSVHRPEGS